jgi:hypothetical protein
MATALMHYITLHYITFFFLADHPDPFIGYVNRLTSLAHSLILDRAIITILFP